MMAPTSPPAKIDGVGMLARDRSPQTSLQASDRLAAAVPAGPAPSPAPASQLIARLLAGMDAAGIRYCHWKSNMRLALMLEGGDDIDVLVDRRQAGAFHELIAACGFKLTVSRHGIGHPGVFHALALDPLAGRLVHLHAYFQIVSGDSLVKNSRLAVEELLLTDAGWRDGVRIPTPEAEIVLFLIRVALKHVNLVEIALAQREWPRLAAEKRWLSQRADPLRARAICRTWFSEIEPALFDALWDTFGDDEASLGTRIRLGRQVGRSLAGRRRLAAPAACASLLHRVGALLVNRAGDRQELVLAAGGAIIALVGPKGTGKSTLSREIAARLHAHLDVLAIHVGKPPTSMLSAIPRAFIPVLRRILAGERPSEYEKTERRSGNRYSLAYVVRMTLLAHDRARALRQAMRAAAAGRVVICDRYPSTRPGTIDGSCFDDGALALCRSPLKRWLMMRERSLYRALPRPDLVIKLLAPLDISVRRDALRDKEGGPDGDAVRRRWDMENGLEFPGVAVARIATDRPLDDTVASVLTAAWAAL
jgi:thymidylate kinase